MIAFSATIGMIGYLILAAVQDEYKTGVRYLGVWLATCGVFPALSINITWLLNNQGGDSKKSAGMALLAIFGQCSSFVSSSVFPNFEGWVFRLFQSMGKNPANLCSLTTAQFIFAGVPLDAA